jgi:membrane glycosyltransferase
VLSELALSSLIAPILLAFQSRSVIQVLLGRDSGWPPNNRGDGSLSLAESWAAGGWISIWGVAGIATTQFLAPALSLWLLPVTLPMMLAPLLIWWTSHPTASLHFTVPADQSLPPVLARQDRILAAWTEPKPEPKVA